MKNNLLPNNINNLANSIIEAIFESLNCVKIGRIIKFYTEDKTADVEILTKQKKEDGSFQNISILKKCLVLGNRITTPILEGDDVVVLFNDYDLNSYFETGTAQEPYSTRKHDLSDGIVLMGLNSLVNAIQYDNSAICLNYEQTRINGNLEVNGDTTQNGNNTITGNNTVNGNVDAMTYSVGGVVGVSGVFVDIPTNKTLTITNGLITAIS